MPRNASVNIENSFVKGLITEATGLNFPENACTETYNCVFHHTGEVSRRLGIDYEQTFAIESTDTTDNAIREFLWKAVALNGEFTFVVLQVGATLNFYSMASTALSATRKSFTVDLNTFKVDGSPRVEGITCSFASGNGFLFVAHPYCEPFYVEYHVDIDDITSAAIDVRIRDWKGLEDNLADDERPNPLTKEHHYNLLNQGWGVNVALTTNTYNWTVGSPLQFWVTAPFFARNDYPSNSDIWWSYKSIMRPILDDHGNVIIPTPTEAFSMIEAQNVDKTGSSLAPKGHYVFTAWNIDRASVEYSANDFQIALDGIPVQTSGYQRPSQIAFYSSRVWYAGVDANIYNTKIYFSKIIEKNTDFGRCYQLNDPTTEKASDLLPSDGGEIKIPEISKILKLMQSRDSLYVFATNGVWRITGTSGVGFTANDYSITKISPINALSETSFVDVEGTPMWWNADGIWTIEVDPTGSSAQVNSLTFTTIQSFIDEIPGNNKRFVKGAYNPLDKVVQWLFRSTEATTIKENYQYDRILNLSLINQAFYPWSIADNCNKIVGIIALQGIANTEENANVINDLGDQVITGAGNVVVERFAKSDVSSRFKYITTSDCFVDTGGTTVTYNPHFLGHLEFGTFGNGPPPAFNGIMVGEDGKLYTYAAIDSTNFNQIQRFDGTGALVDYPQTTFRSDVETELSNIFVSFSEQRQIIPVPYSPYFYFMGAGTNTGGDFGIARQVFGLYKIDATGNIVFQGAQGYIGTVFDTSILAALTIHGVSIKGKPLVDPTNNEIIFAVTGSGSIIFVGSSAAVVNLPSVNTFLANSGQKDGTWTSLFLPSSDEWNMYARSNINTYTRVNSMFFLPIKLSDNTWDNLLCAYIPEGEAANMIANPGNLFINDTFRNFALTNPNGFVVARTVNDDGPWTVFNSHFKAEDNTDLIPFADLGLDKNGVFEDPNFDDWDTPSVQFDTDTELGLLIWGRHYKNTAANMAPDGSYASALIQTWSPTARSATFLKSVSGVPWVASTDMGLSVAAGAYPYLPQLFFFLYPDFESLYIYTRDDGGFDGGSFASAHYSLAKFADVHLDLTPDVTGLTFSDFNNPTFQDWQTSGESEDFISYFITGYKVHGDAIRKFQPNYTQIYTRNDLFSVFDFQSRFDYAISGDTGRWDNKQRIIQDDVNYKFRTKRLKNRGHGKTLQYKVNSVTQQPFNIIGWSSWETGNVSA